MSKTEWISASDRYIYSVAQTAEVNEDNVRILRVEETASRAFEKKGADRLLLASSVNVITSILLGCKQPKCALDQPLLNDNLRRNGLPHSNMILPYQFEYDAGVSASSSSPIGPIIGGVVGFSSVLLCFCFVHRILGSKVTHRIGRSCNDSSSPVTASPSSTVDSRGVWWGG
jgi:hypothetical protein